MNYIDEFLNIDISKQQYRAVRYPRLFYLWGHSYEFERDNNWELLESICEKLGKIGKEKVKDLIWLTGIEQCIFGLDFPYTKPCQIKDAMKKIKECINELDLENGAQEKVFGENLLNMIKK